MEVTPHRPFQNFLGLVALGQYALPAYPFPWSCWVIARDDSSPGVASSVVPSLLLLPMYRWAFDSDLLLAWANGQADVPTGARLLRRLMLDVPPEWVRMPGPFNLSATDLAGRSIEQRCAARVRASRDGCREVARSHPWTFLSETLLPHAEKQLGLESEPSWPECAQRALAAAQAVPMLRGRPRRAPDVDRSLALREEVQWLYARAERRLGFGAALEALIAGAEDRDRWPLHGVPDAAEGKRLRTHLNVFHQRLREHDAVPVVVPLFDQAWARTSSDGWAEAPDGGPESRKLRSRVADERFGGVVRVAVGGTFENFRFCDEGLRSWLAWAAEVPVRTAG